MAKAKKRAPAKCAQCKTRKRHTFSSGRSCSYCKECHRKNARRHTAAAKKRNRRAKAPRVPAHEEPTPTGEMPTMARIQARLTDELVECVEADARARLGIG